MPNVTMNRFLRPSASDSRPNSSAPNTSPSRYTVAIAPTWVELRPRVSVLFRMAPTAPAIVISRPSRTQAVPRARTMRVWNGAQVSRSIRAGMRLRMVPSVRAPVTSAMYTSRRPGRGRPVSVQQDLNSDGRSDAGESVSGTDAVAGTDGPRPRDVRQVLPVMGDTPVPAYCPCNDKLKLLGSPKSGGPCAPRGVWYAL